MALLVDGLVSSVDDIVQVDSGLGDVARAEGINIDHKLQLAQRDCELKIAQFIVNHGLEARLGSLNNLPRLDRVIVSDGLKRWFSLHALHLFYSDAYYRVLNDRYGKKLEHFAKLALDAWEAYVDTGIMCVFNPIRQGQVLRIETSDVPIGAGTYSVAMAWVDPSGKSGSLSEIDTITIGPGEGFRVVPAPSPSGVAGYDIYAAEVGVPLSRQNPVPVEIDSAYTAGVIVVNADQPAVPSQTIDFVIRKSRMFTRG